MQRLSERAADRLPTAILIAATVVCVAGVALTIVAWPDLKPGDSFPSLFSALAGVLYAGLGVLIVHRARNLIGWFLEGVGFGLALLTLASSYAVVGIVSSPGSLVAPRAVGALASDRLRSRAEPDHRR